MIPDADGMLGVAAGKLMGDIAPGMEPGYGQGSVATISLVMLMSAQEFDKAADVRVWENDRMRELLARGGAWSPFDESAAPRRASLQISALNAEAAPLKAALIALHEAVEADAGADAKALERDILGFLKESSDRRRLYLPAM